MSARIELVGRLAGTPEMRYTPSGMAVVEFTVVTSRRVKDQATGEWSDADTSFWICKAFKQMAENVAASLDRGMEVAAVGRAVQESWEDKQTGGKRSKVVVLVDAIGPSLRGATARVEKSGPRAGAREEVLQQARSGQGRAGEDPWAAGAGVPVSGGWGGAGGGEEPPF